MCYICKNSSLFFLEKTMMNFKNTIVFLEKYNDEISAFQ